MTAAPNLDDIPEPEPSPLDKLRAALVDTDGLDHIPEPEWLIRDLLPVNSLAWLIGKPGCGKSFVALDMACSVATGQPFQLWSTKPGKALYLAAEGVSGVRQRVRAWETINGTAEGVQWLPMAIQTGSDDWGTLMDLCEEIQPALIVLDTQARITVGAEENSSKDMGLLVHELERLRKATGACVLVVHHQGRSGDNMRGSSSLDGGAVTVIRVTKDDDLVTIEVAKQKDADEHDDIHLRLVETAKSATLTTNDGDTSAKTKAAHKMAAQWWDTFGEDEVTASKLIAAEITTERVFYRHVKTLVDEQVAVKRKSGQVTYYRLLRSPDHQLRVVS